MLLWRKMRPRFFQWPQCFVPAVVLCEDPQQVSEYSKDIFDHMFSTERSFQPRPRHGTADGSGSAVQRSCCFSGSRCHYLADQREINTKMRAILVDWLVEVGLGEGVRQNKLGVALAQVHMKYRLKPVTLFMAVNIIDRYLSMRPSCSCVLYSRVTKGRDGKLGPPACRKSTRVGEIRNDFSAGVVVLSFVAHFCLPTHPLTPRPTHRPDRPTYLPEYIQLHTCPRYMSLFVRA